jgi:penicillin-binding protein 1A
VLNFPRKTWPSRLKRWLLSLDSRVDSGLYSARTGFRDRYERFQLFMDRFRVTGGKRLAVEMACEGLTLGAGASVILLALAVPAFRETSEDWLKKQDLAVTFLDRYGQEIGKRGIKHDDSVKLDDLPDHLVKAALATEDRRFFEHFGVDVVGTGRAVMANARASGVVQGGSSVTQQLAKNLFLNNERSIERKIKEAFLALWLEQRLSKREILKLYLDRAYMGGGTFGVVAAAEFYFNKSVKDLTLSESAMLAGLFKAPTKFAPHVNLPAARARANVVLSNMVEAGFLTEGQVIAARRNPATPIDRRKGNTPDYYLDWAFEDIRKLVASGALGHERVLIVKTPFDGPLQKRAEVATEAILRQYDRDYDVNQAGVVVMEPDGAVRAIVGGRDYGASQFNRATDAMRQPGSSWKTFVYAAAMADPSTAKSYKPNSIVTDSPVCIGNWCPKNYSGGYAGSMPLTTALAKSYNTIPVHMSIALAPRNAKGERVFKEGRAKIIQTAKRMGLTSELKDTPSLPIGAVDVSVLEMTTGYATLANGGRKAVAHAGLEVRNSSGDLIWRFDRDGPKTDQALPAEVVGDLNFMLSKVPEEGTGRRAALDGLKSAGKTGTTNAYRDAWYVGFTGNLVAGIWYGNDDYTSTNNMTGGSLPAMTWKEIMSFAHTGIELRAIPGVPGSGVNTTPSQAVATTDPASIRPQTMSKRSAETLETINGLFKQAQPPTAPRRLVSREAEAENRAKPF